MEFYIIVFIYRGVEYYCIWISGEKDSLVTKDDGILVWNDLSKLMEYCLKENLEVTDNPITYYDIDYLFGFVDSKIVSHIDSEKIINLWNICSDVANACDCIFIGDNEENNFIYNKLFYGNNLETINQSGKKYIPEFTSLELKKLKYILFQGGKIIVEQIDK